MSLAAAHKEQLQNLRLLQSKRWELAYLNLIALSSQSIFKFLTKHFGTDKFTRTFKPGWSEKFPWLHYLKNSDCFVCF